MGEDFTDDARYKCHTFIWAPQSLDLGEPDFRRHLGRDECAVDTNLISDKIGQMVGAGAKWIRYGQDGDGDHIIAGWK